MESGTEPGTFKWEAVGCGCLGSKVITGTNSSDLERNHG